MQPTLELCSEMLGKDTAEKENRAGLVDCSIYKFYLIVFECNFFLNMNDMLSTTS